MRNRTTYRCVLVMAIVLFVAGALRASERVELKRSGDRVDVLIGGRPFTTYYFDPQIAKPYFQPLRSARGTIVTRGFPIGNIVLPEHEHDPNLEPHQRPMYFGHGNIDGYDFWGEAVWPKWSPQGDKFGRTVFRKLDDLRGGADSGVLRADFNLVDSEGKVIASETQAYLFSGDQNTRAIDCTFTIHADHGPVKMGDTKEGTFAIRLAPELNSPPARIVNSRGSEGEENVWGKRADWVDYDGDVRGEPVGIAIFDNPRNFRHPTYWHARGYGLFAANPFGIREFTHNPHRDGSYTIPAYGSLTLRYRVLIHHGDDREAKVAAAYRRYAEEH